MREGECAGLMNRFRRYIHAENVPRVAVGAVRQGEVLFRVEGNGPGISANATEVTRLRVLRIRRRAPRTID